MAEKLTKKYMHPKIEFTNVTWGQSYKHPEAWLKA